jgi:hypothetical protein
MKGSAKMDQEQKDKIQRLVVEMIVEAQKIAGQPVLHSMVVLQFDEDGVTLGSSKSGLTDEQTYKLINAVANNLSRTLVKLNMTLSELQDRLG